MTVTRAAVPLCAGEFEFADGTYLFQLNAPQRNELQNRCGVKAQHPLYGEIVVPTGLGAILSAVMAGRYKTGENGQTTGLLEEARFNEAWLYEIVRLALIGGGRGELRGQEVKVGPVDAKRLLLPYETCERPLMELWDLAFLILWTTCKGYIPPKEGGDEPKKDQPG
ncbi:MAG: hypothetical protein J7521_20425 [Caulobacter sp.]|nr:hypothetical protein [Caulobacter sp.]